MKKTYSYFFESKTMEDLEKQLDEYMNTIQENPGTEIMSIQFQIYPAFTGEKIFYALLVFKSDDMY